MDIRSFYKEFLLPKFKFALTSSVATALDYGIYICLTMLLAFSESISHAISYSIAMVVNFFLQKQFIFASNRKLGAIFSLSVIFSLIGWLLSQGLFNILIYSFPFLKSWDIIAKLIVTATIFLYNFYTKRFSFENKLPWIR